MRSGEGLEPLLSARRHSQLAFLLVLASLLLLAILPVLIHTRTERLNSEVAEVIEPARAALTEMGTALALEASGTRGFLLTGDQHYATDARAAQASRGRVALEFLERAQQLGPAIAARAAELMDTLRLADTMISALYGGRISRATYLLHLGEQHVRFQATVEAMTVLDMMIDSISDERRMEIRTLERSGALLTVLLVAFALVAAALVARLGQRYRSLAIGFDARARELERVTRSRTRLIRGFTHDVKNPLGAADGSLALLEDGVLGELTAKQLDSVRRGRRSIRAALDLIGHLMDLARAEAGQISIRREPTDIRALIAEVTEEFRAQAETGQLTLTIDVPPELPLIDTDPARARQILVNLVSNAVKYTSAGGRVTVRAELLEGAPAHAVAATATGSWLTVDVTDTGSGIKAEDRALLFQEFSRFDPGAAQGSGIGLAISQRVARALGGEIRVRSEPGVGSTFTLWLPTA